MKCLSRKKEEDKEDKEVYISAITLGLSAKHKVFNKFIEVQLPLHYPNGSDTNEDDFEYRIFKWDDEGSFEFVDIKPVILNNMASFQAISFSRLEFFFYCIHYELIVSIHLSKSISYFDRK